MNVLIVEDNKMVQIVTKMMVEAHVQGVVDVAETAKAAFEQTQKQAYDLILMDIGLPDGDGFELTKKIKAESSLNQKVRVVAVTAHANEQAQGKAKELQMDGFVEKPLTAETLKKILKNLSLV